MGLPDTDAPRQVPLDKLMSGDVAHHTLCPGISLCRLSAGQTPGLALQIAPEALQAGQVQRVLERRFEHASAFDGCFVFLDAKGSLVIWHALPPQRNLLNRLLSRMLSLANLETLDARTRR